MRSCWIFAGSVACIATFPAHAEFVLRSPPNTGLQSETAPAAAARIPRTGPRPYSPRGFGDDVPLRLAAEQIVPPGTKVEFSPDVSPDAEVTWRGGQAWWVALAKAIEPHRYKVERKPGVARIVLR